MADGLLRTLQRLLDDGAVAWSAVSRTQRDALRPLLESGVLTRERSGAGQRLVATAPDVVAQFARQRYPAGLDAARGASGDAPGAAASGAADGAPTGLSTSEGVRRFRDAKRGAQSAEVLLLRGRPGSVVTYDGDALAVGELTNHVGVAAVLLRPDVAVAVRGGLAIVENQDAFFRFEALGVDAPVACFAGGRLSNRVLRWLARPPMDACPITHCPDYDPVGLSEFVRLHRACGSRVTLFCPPDLDALVRRYGKPALYTQNARLLPTLHAHAHPTLERILSILERHGAGLEQELLLART